MIAFDTSVVDLTDELNDPVERACSASSSAAAPTSTRRSATARRSSRHPQKTVLILITDLDEGGDQDSTLRRAASLVRAGVRLIVLLALSDDGAPGYDHGLAADVAALGAPVFACTPDLFLEMLAAALEGRDVNAWAADEGIVTSWPARPARGPRRARARARPAALELRQRAADGAAHDRGGELLGQPAPDPRARDAELDAQLDPRARRPRRAGRASGRAGRCP